MRDAQLPASRSRRRRTAGLVAAATAVAGLATAYAVAAPPSPSAPGSVAEAATAKDGTTVHAGTPAEAAARAKTGTAATPWLRPAGAPLTVIAHRGAPSAAPENTLVSDEVARRGGADWIENDVQPSKDGVPYILHDTTVDRTTDGTGPLRSLTSAQLNALDAGSWFAPAYAGARVPTLAAQLADLRDRGGKLLLEIKGRHSHAEVARIIRDVREQGMADRVFVQSFDIPSLRYTHELAPELPLGLLRSTLDADPVALAEELDLAAYNVSDAALSTRPGIVRDLHTAGVAVNVWTVDTPARWKALDTLGVDGVITNRPTELGGWSAGRTS
ncbi:glycerophosphodiester phosphodiesterase family protein [Streptomyces sp. NPDC017254]|uniref:glycerophosphodiester phosphodiesterase n=1 Tax=unclassified Streptomyces TaxID=2593676 RepID=UPI0037A9421C